MNARVALVSQPNAEHPHALLLAVAQQALRDLQQRRVPVAAVIDTGYRADPEHFAMQMGVFERMRETERVFRQLINGDKP